jgi:predicted nucleic acid-binding protein
MRDNTFAIDANVILRHLLQDDVELSPKAKAIFEDMQDGRFTVLCEPVTLAEVVWVLKSFYKLSRQQISTELMQLAMSTGFVIPNKPRYLLALQLYGGLIPHFGDACACAAAIDKCEGRLFSFDRELSSVPGVERVEELQLEADG